MSNPAILFMDWLPVSKGMLQASLDPGQISASGKEMIDRMSAEFGVKYHFGSHGFIRNQLPSGIRITVELPVKSEPWLKADRPWEKMLDFYKTVIRDEGKYKCWYTVDLPDGETRMTFDQGRAMKTSGKAMCYAESHDGMTWVKPNLGVFSFQGSKDNNIVSLWGNSTTVFRDDSAPRAETYKCLHFDKIDSMDEGAENSAHSRYGLYGITSPDGIHWTKHPEPLIRRFCDTQNVAYWDSALQKYRAYVRGHYGGRAIYFSETANFHDWPEPELLIYPGPDEEPSTDYYASGFTTYPGDSSLKLIFGSIYIHNTDQVHVRLAVGRDGKHFHWLSKEPIIDIGASDRWDSERVYANPNLLKLPDDRLALPISGYNFSHNETRFQQLYKEFQGECRYGWAIWENDRIAGIEAVNAGEFFTTATTPEVPGERQVAYTGFAIEINARTTRAGELEAEIWENNQCIEGYSFANFRKLTGDYSWIKCEWNGSSDLSSLKGRKIQLRFRMRSAKIFGYRYVQEQNGI